MYVCSRLLTLARWHAGTWAPPSPSGYVACPVGPPRRLSSYLIGKHVQHARGRGCPQAGRPGSKLLPYRRVCQPHSPAPRTGDDAAVVVVVFAVAVAVKTAHELPHTAVTVASISLNSTCPPQDCRTAQRYAIADAPDRSRKRRDTSRLLPPVPPRPPVGAHCLTRLYCSLEDFSLLTSADIAMAPKTPTRRNKARPSRGGRASTGSRGGASAGARRDSGKRRTLLQAPLPSPSCTNTDPRRSWPARTCSRPSEKTLQARHRRVARDPPLPKDNGSSPAQNTLPATSRCQLRCHCLLWWRTNTCLGAGNCPDGHHRTRAHQMAKSGHSGPARSHRSLSREPLPRRKSLRHPRQACHHPAKRHTACPPPTRSMGSSGVSIRDETFYRYPHSILGKLGREGPRWGAFCVLALLAYTYAFGYVLGSLLWSNAVSTAFFGV
jgi:hypothetical protein